MVGGDEQPHAVENVDAEVVLSDGSRWGATIVTVAEVQRLMKRWAGTGECAGGSYFWCSDGVVVRDPGVATMTRVLTALHDADTLRSALHRLAEPSE